MAKRTVLTAVRFTPEEWEAVTRAALDVDVTVSAFIRNGAMAHANDRLKRIERRPQESDAAVGV